MSFTSRVWSCISEWLMPLAERKVLALPARAAVIAGSMLRWWLAAWRLQRPSDSLDAEDLQRRPVGVRCRQRGASAASVFADGFGLGWMVIFSSWEWVPPPPVFFVQERG